VATYSNSSPKPLEVPVRRACLPSTLSMVEYLRYIHFRTGGLGRTPSSRTSIAQRQSCSIPMKDPTCREPGISVLPQQTRNYSRRTGPTRSGIKMDTNDTLTRINMKPSSVTIFGASHNGSSLTKPFHYSALVHIQERPARGVT
jgi:hypothetical protein